jgi:hypothetical protein
VLSPDAYDGAMARWTVCSLPATKRVAQVRVKHAEMTVSHVFGSTPSIESSVNQRMFRLVGTIAANGSESTSDRLVRDSEVQSLNLECWTTSGMYWKSSCGQAFGRCAVSTSPCAPYAVKNPAVNFLKRQRDTIQEIASPGNLCVQEIGR